MPDAALTRSQSSHAGRWVRRGSQARTIHGPSRAPGRGRGRNIAEVGALIEHATAGGARTACSLPMALKPAAVRSHLAQVVARLNDESGVPAERAARVIAASRATSSVGWGRRT